jgi:hypothetical protein
MTLRVGDALKSIQGGRLILSFLCNAEGCVLCNRLSIETGVSDNAMRHLSASCMSGRTEVSFLQ